MKHLTFTLTLLMAVLTAGAQTSGEILYEEQIDMHRRIPAERAEMKEFIPPFRTQKSLLTFTENQYTYQNLPDEQQAPPPPSPEGTEVRMTFVRPLESWYYHIDEDRQVNQREFFGRKFLIKDAAPTFAWKLTGKQKDILGHTCQEALFQDSIRTIVAWFAPEIPVPGGPQEFGQLPGMILEMNFDAGERIIRAVSITPKAPETLTIAEPKEGKTVTRAEFQAIVKEKMGEMNWQGGSPGAPGMQINVITRP
jgi:GLPGLI family protein